MYPTYFWSKYSTDDIAMQMADKSTEEAARAVYAELNKPHFADQTGAAKIFEQRLAEIIERSKRYNAPEPHLLLTNGKYTGGFLYSSYMRAYLAMKDAVQKTLEEEKGKHREALDSFIAHTEAYISGGGVDKRWQVLPLPDFEE